MSSKDSLPKHLEVSFFLLRASIFLVMFMWTIDKFLRVDHAKTVFEKFYFLSGLGNSVVYLFATIELILIIAFVLGLKKRLTYGGVLVFHAVSTLSAFKQYLNPFEGPNLLFFAAWPMLASCIALYLLRDYDQLLCLCKTKRGLK